jgi:hypothetical protein
MGSVLYKTSWASLLEAGCSEIAIATINLDPIFSSFEFRSTGALANTSSVSNLKLFARDLSADIILHFKASLALADSISIFNHIFGASFSQASLTSSAEAAFLISPS